MQTQTHPVHEAPATADVGIVCPQCLDTLAPDGACMNVGACRQANETAARGSRRDSAKFTAAAWQGSGRVD